MRQGSQPDTSSAAALVADATLPAPGPVPVPRSDEASRHRVRRDGRHLVLGDHPLRVRGATYGTFVSRGDGQPYPEADVIRRDLAAMSAAGLDTVRVYSVPPVEILEAALEHGLRVLAGVHYEDWRQHGTGQRVHRAVLDAGRRALDEALARLAGLPQVLALSIGNEVPGDLVRLHGIRPVERVLSQLAAHVHDADPGMLVTYSNFPTTEYLAIDGLDVTSFNVFLEDPARLRAYLRHLHTVAGETPLLVTELGLAAEVHGEAAQAAALLEQLRIVDEAGCAGATVFSWTDEWGVAGQAVDGWGFGISRADRSPKPALDVVSRWAGSELRDLRAEWPTLSVVVCAYNEERLLGECLHSLARLDYPALEVIICDDGSTDATLEIARRYPFTVLALPHGGLSAARNAGAAAASGEYVAYLDADAHCHPGWPYHLVLSMEDDGVVATGGPNLPVLDVGLAERVVAASPGGPVEVLVGDDRAEHVPGCNMTVRRDDLLAVGGFDVAFTSAGDDVDVCWKLLDRGGKIAFAPAAQVRHHRRNSVLGYLRQQRNYGRSERMVASRHAHRFNRLGQARWAGSIYGGLRMLPSVLRPVVYHGPVGGAPYQTVVASRGAAVAGWTAALLPLTVPLALLGMGLALLHPAWLALPAAALATVLGYAAAIAAAARPPRDEPRPGAWRALVTWLHVAQPMVRAWGRLRGPGLPAMPPPSPPSWTGDRLAWLMSLERQLAGRGCTVRFADPSDAWDLQASRGPVLAARVSTAVQWGWTPQAQTRLVLRPARLALLLIVGGLAAAHTTPLVGPGLVAVALGADAAALVPTVRRALRYSTAHSAPERQDSGERAA